MITLQLLVILVCMLAAAFFAGIETGVISIHRMRLRHFVRQGLPGALTLQRFLDSPDRLFGTTLVGTNLALVMLSVVSASLAIRFLGRWGEPVSTGVVTVLALVFCEYLPKSWFHSRPLERCRRYAGLLRVAEIFTRPLARTVIWLTRWLVPDATKVFSRPAPFVTREDLKVLAREGEKDGVLSPRERVMIHRVFELSGKTAHQIMVPRNQMTSVRHDTPIAEFYDIARRTGHTRMPVFDAEQDAFVGVINVFFVLSARLADVSHRTVGEFARRPLFVSEAMAVDDILPRMRGHRHPLCLVRNEAGAVTGLITTEDILEEIVGKL